MKIAMNQPYFFPYLGYFQLIDAVDRFVFYDDVNFIKHGWINRNRILVGGAPIYFTVPLEKISSNKKINQTMIHQSLFPIWREKFLKSLQRSYRKAPHFTKVFELVQRILKIDHTNIASLAMNSITQCSDFMKLTCDFGISSRDFPNMKPGGVDKIIEICRSIGAKTYVNAPGGKNLYTKYTFKKNNISLSFLNPRLNPYPQLKEGFFPSLSILDIMMNCSIDQIQNMLKQYSLD